MNNYLLLLSAIAVLLIGSAATGVELTNYYKSVSPRTCQETLQYSNKEFIWLPESVSTLFMNDSIILHFSMANGANITIYGMVGDHEIYDLSCSTTRAPDAEVWMSDVTALQLATSTKPITTFVENWQSGNIVLKTYNPQTEQKLLDADNLMANDNEPVPPVIRAYFSQFIGQ